MRAIRTRVTRKAQIIPPVRAFLDSHWKVTPESLASAINFPEGASGDLRATFVTRATAKHFLDGAQKTADTARDHFPDAAIKTIKLADRVCAHRFHFLGRDAVFNEVIDWFWIPDTNARWPWQHSEDFPKGFYNRPDRPGDIKHPWELNRHQYWVTLGKAYCYTRDEKYARAFTDQLLSWIVANPFRMGINWFSEMEMGIRLISWSNAFWLMKDSPYFQEHGLDPFLCALYQHARYLRRRLTTGWLAANNHLLGETAGLFAFATLFPQFKESSEFKQVALSIFADALERQIYPDGVNREQATGYHRFVLDFIWTVVRLGQLNGDTMPPVILQRLERMLEYEAAITAPNGLAPQIGDCDDGRGLYSTESVPFFDFRGWLGAGAWQFQRNDLWRAANGGNEETLWLLGAENWTALRGMIPHHLPQSSIHFPDGGHCILRTGDAPENSFVFVRCGEFGLGLDGSSAHSHADILAPVIVLNGIPIIIDSGTFGYLLGDAERDLFRSTALHNTMAPRGIDQARMFPVWGWEKVPLSHITEWTSAESHVRMAGTCQSFEDYTHHRSIELRNKPVRIEIRDHLESRRSCDAIDAHLLLAPETTAKCVSANEISVTRGGNVIAAIETTGFDEIDVAEVCYSPSYGIKLKTQRIRLTVRRKVADTCIIIHA
ncbi:MAG: alginate lyase family protein [Candidatus Hydrogenedentes bacterium]|nr:alginate lyase family protein [Candidatus Hydrogenedentota bacterium]